MIFSQRAVISTAGVTIAYLLAARLGAALAPGVSGAVAFWPAAGLALAAILRGGRRMLPAVALGALLANLFTGVSLTATVGIALGAALEALLGATLLVAVGFRGSLERMRDVGALVVLAAGISTVVGATIGVVSLSLAGALPHGQSASTWAGWWIGDGSGDVLVTGALLVLGFRPLGPRRRAAAAERGAVIAWLIASAVVVWLTVRGHGPLAGGTPGADLVRAQGFLTVVMITTLLVTAARTEREAAENALSRLADSQRALAEALRLTAIGSFEWDVGAGQTTWSDELYRILGLDRETHPASYAAWLERVHPDDREVVAGTLKAAFVKCRPYSLVHRIVRPDGSVRTVACRGRVEVDDAGRPVRVLGTGQDVTASKLAEDALAHEARHDPLTGLPNRTLFLDRLEHALARARRSGTQVAVLFMDLDDFKLVNDTRGHDAGDLLLVALAPRLTGALRPGDTVARFGGDEFVVLCEDLVDSDDAVAIAGRITDACRRPIVLGEHEHLVTLSVGMVVVDGGRATPTDILRDADAAMYSAKSGGKGRTELFDDRMRARVLDRIAVETALRRALGRDELRVHYQPILSLERERIVGVEALLRWEHPVRGLLEPEAFMQVAESSGLIVPIGEWVLEQACRQAALWRDAQPSRDPVRMSVNLSARQVARSDVAGCVERVLAATGLEPGLLDLEITEHALLPDSDHSTAALRELKSLGVRLVLDDFGTGYSSLSHLRRFTIDALKIDRSFVDGADRDSDDGAVVKAVLGMAGALGVDVTAEGVETLTQLSLLRDHGCRFAQGYLFAPPGPADDLADLLGLTPAAAA